MIEKMGGRVEVINGKGCSRLFMDFSSSFRAVSSFPLEPSSPANSVSTLSESRVKIVKSNGPFSGLVVCVTGLSKETRKQVKEATERLGGQYSPHLHPQCTHLVVQSINGRKFDHALKHGPTIGLFLVTIAWFVDSVRNNVRLDEVLYGVNKIVDNGITNDGLQKLTKQPCSFESSRFQCPENESIKHTLVPTSISGQTFYIDDDIPADLRSKVVEAISTENASLVYRWFVGCNVSHVVCEGPSVQKYLGHSSNLVTPPWVLKSAKENSLQRLVHLSSDLARYTGAMLDTVQHGVSKEEVNRATLSGDIPSSEIKFGFGERQIRANLAKDGVRKRRNRRMQTCQTPIRPITPGRLLDSICWSVSEPTSTATIYTESSSVENGIFFDAKENAKESEASFVNLSRPLTESEKSELIFKGHFLTVMFPVDRFSEMGPCSRTFFSDKGFTCLQVLDYIYAFYQENMSDEEVEIGFHTDSTHADRLRSAYSSKETAETGRRVEFKRISFLGSRKSFEMLKRVSGDNNSNLYELLIRA